jgi:hypothetical protein
MKCRRAKQLVFDFLDGVIADSDRVGLEQHLNECESCETFASQLSRSLDLLHRAPEETPSDNFNWKVRLKIAREKNKLGEAITAQRNLFKTWNLRFAVSAMSTFVLILAGGYILWSSGRLADLKSPGGPAQDHFARVQPTQPSERPAPTRTTPRRLYNPPYGLGTLVSDQPGFEGPFASTPGAIDESQYNYVLDESQQMILRPDSLVMIKMRSLPLRYRINQLQDQVEQLQKYLRECEGRRQD